MKEFFVSKHHVQSSEDLPFSAVEYSQFKYGSGNIAVKYGEELAEVFITEILATYRQVPSMVAFSSPRVGLPTASDALMQSFIRTVNAFFLQETGIEPMREGIIKKKVSHIGDYSAMDKVGRDAMLQSKDFSLDPSMIKENDVVVSVDDIKITWSHEGRIRETLQAANVQNDVFFTTYAELTNDAIDSGIESVLNSYSVKTLDDVQAIIDNNDFVLNTRVTKLILKVPLEEFRAFIHKQTPEFTRELLLWAISNKYDQEPTLAHTISYLQTIVEEVIA